jgi:FkbM family methyltransferase
MKYIAKLFTALRLLLHGDWRQFRLQIRANLSDWRVRRAGGRPIVYRAFGFPMICHPDWPDSLRYFGHENVDEWESRLIRRWLEPGDTAFDFGANIGIYTFAAAAAVGRGGRVVAIDADPHVVDKLRRGVQILATPQVTPVHRAITQENGSVTFYVRANHEDTGGQSLRPEEADRAACTAVTVPACTVPHLLGELGIDAVPALVKVDIEGAEGQMLAATPPGWFAADGPCWVIEINPGALAKFGTTARAVADFFPPAHFDCWLLPKHPLDPADAPRLRRLTETTTFADSHYYNVFALPRAESRRLRRRRLAAFFPAG